MPRRTLILCTMAALTAGGCSTSAPDEPFAADPNLEVQPTLRAAVAGVVGTVAAVAGVFNLRLGPSPAVYAQRLADDDLGPAERRRAINGLVGDAGGRGDVYADFYAAVAIDRDGEDPLVRATAVRALNRAEAQGRTDLFVRLLADPSERVRIEAAKALSKLPDAAAIAPLLDTAGDGEENLDVRLAAILALRHYREPEVVERLVALLDAEPFSLAFQARYALVRMLGVDRGFERDAWLAAS